MADSIQAMGEVTDRLNSKAEDNKDPGVEDDELGDNDNEECIAFSDAHLEINQNVEIIQNQDLEEATLSKFIILKNLVVFSVSMVLLYSAFNSFQSLQSTLNLDGSLGTVGLCLVYVTYAVSTLFVVTYTLSRFSYKRVMMTSMLPFIVYACTGFYSNWTTVITASVLIGIGTAHILVLQQAFVTALAKQYSTVTKTTFKDAIDTLFGIFFGLMTTNLVWGNIFSSMVLRPETANETHPLEYCGGNFCPRLLNQTQLIPPQEHQLYMFSGFCVGLGCLAIFIVAVFLNNIPPLPAPKRSITTMLKSVFCHILKSRTQKMLIIPSVFRGLHQGFIIGDFTVAFISCPLGVSYIGFVMVAYGSTRSVLSVIFGKLAKFTGHLLLFVIGFVADISVGVTLLVWQPDPSKPAIVFILAAVWAISDVVYTATLTALYSIHFKENSNAAFSSVRLLAALGWAISFALSSSVCMKPKIITLLAITSLSLIMLVVLRFSSKKSKTTEL